MPTITFVVMTDFTGTVQQVAEHGLQVIQRSLNLCGQEVELNNAPAESWDTEVNVTDRISMQINEGLVADDEEDVADFYRRRVSLCQKVVNGNMLMLLRQTMVRKVMKKSMKKPMNKTMKKIRRNNKK